jgi:hypothetical protein
VGGLPWQGVKHDGLSTAELVLTLCQLQGHLSLLFFANGLSELEFLSDCLWVGYCTAMWIVNGAIDGKNISREGFGFGAGESKESTTL